MQPALFNTHRNTPTENAKQIPQWLLRRLDANGVIDLTTGATRKARPAKCAKCHSWVIRGLDADWGAFAVDADPEPLTAEGEALARLAGIRTYELSVSGGRPELNARDRWSIAGHPAGSRRTDVLAAHDCERPANLPRGPSRLPDPAAPADLPDQPPF